MIGNMDEDTHEHPHDTLQPPVHFSRKQVLSRHGTRGANWPLLKEYTLMSDLLELTTRHMMICG
jgi:hypothetical protein